MIPTGTSALLYVPASTGAAAVPPIFAREATAQVKISSFKSFASKIITPTWKTRIIKPVSNHTGAPAALARSALDAIRATTI